jgi:hypothetical protein
MQQINNFGQAEEESLDGSDVLNILRIQFFHFFFKSRFSLFNLKIRGLEQRSFSLPACLPIASTSSSTHFVLYLGNLNLQSDSKMQFISWFNVLGSCIGG